MGHCEMLLAVAGLTDKEIEGRARRLASGDWSGFPPAERLAFGFALKLTREPAAVTDADVRARPAGGRATGWGWPTRPARPAARPAACSPDPAVAASSSRSASAACPPPPAGGRGDRGRYRQRGRRLWDRGEPVQHHVVPAG